ncbi:hypothetical protein QFC20_002225 [Naganishia adeliensis]|uniref:Uncharacterized protein n=1 Tax=Naganishia adeliensis TaxID=92952 RepID=A0ACC2WMZ2_9TREE|nr:hypothetical protein QFC20_002225 [Naganishia adeliensis]
MVKLETGEHYLAALLSSRTMVQEGKVECSGTSRYLEREWSKTTGESVMSLNPSCRSIRHVAQSAITGKEPQLQGLDGLQAMQKLGTSGLIVPGTTIIFNDPPGPNGYMIYPSNFIGEAVLGAWKALATSPTLTALQQSRRMVTNTEEDEQTGAVALPSRYNFPKCGRAGTWHDNDGQNAWFLTHFSPFAAIEEQGSWMARARSGEVFMFERAVIVDRMAAHAAGGAVDAVGKMSGAIAGLPWKGQDIMAPLRTSFFESLGAVVKPSDKPLVVYMDHQSQGRRLIKSQHERLVQALKELVDIAEVHVTNIQKMNPTERVELFGRATVGISRLNSAAEILTRGNHQVLLSVFHDDSINQIFMPPTNRTTVIEMYDPGSYAPDWHLVANMAGHRYYPIHFDQIGLQRASGRVATSGMDGDKLIVDEGFVAKLIRKILTEPDPEKLAKFVDDNTDIDGA